MNFGEEGYFKQENSRPDIFKKSACRRATLFVER